MGDVTCASSHSLSFRYLEWLKRGMSKEVGYMVRAAVHSQAKCYLQVSTV